MILPLKKKNFKMDREGHWIFEGDDGASNTVNLDSYTKHNIIHIDRLPVITRSVSDHFVRTVLTLIGEDNVQAASHKRVLVFIDVMIEVLDTIFGAQLCGKNTVTFTTTSFPPFLGISDKVECANFLFPRLEPLFYAMPILDWHPTTIYPHLHEDQKTQIMTVLMCRHRLRTADEVQTLGLLPYELVEHIFNFLCRPPFYFYRRCLQCKKIETARGQLKRCGGCKMVLFCNKHCQANCETHITPCARSSHHKKSPYDYLRIPPMISPSDSKYKLLVDMVYGEHNLVKLLGLNK